MCPFIAAPSRAKRGAGRGSLAFVIPPFVIPLLSLRRRPGLSTVMPGLDPGIQEPRSAEPAALDCRVEPGNDGVWGMASPLFRSSCQGAALASTTSWPCGGAGNSWMAGPSPAMTECGALPFVSSLPPRSTSRSPSLFPAHSRAKSPPRLAEFKKEPPAISGLGSPPLEGAGDARASISFLRKRRSSRPHARRMPPLWPALHGGRTMRSAPHAPFLHEALT